MNLGQLRFAKATAEERSFSKAAEKCNVAQPALTLAIKLLEGEFGGLLCHRERLTVTSPPDSWRARSDTGFASDRWHIWR